MSAERGGLHRALWLAGWPVRTLLLGLIVGYQRLVSPLFPPSCRYHPCCSAYGATAVRRHGAAKGVILTVGRVARCNPFSGGGINPVPPRGRWRAAVTTTGQDRAGSGSSEPPRARSRVVTRGGIAGRPAADCESDVATGDTGRTTTITGD